MTSIDCGEYVDMGEHNKPLCKKSGYRPAECELCPTRVASLEAENAKLRERVSELEELTDHRHYIPQEWYATLKAENAKLRELVSLMDKRDVLLPCRRGCDADCRFYGSHCERIGALMGELGFEVES